MSIDYEVLWSEVAENDLINIVEYIALDNPSNASEILNKIKEKGILPPEGCINPLDFLTVVQKFLKLEKVGGKGSPLIVESIDAEGTVQKITI